VRAQEFRLAGAVARLILFAYSSLTATSLKLINCIEVPSGSNNWVVFDAGETNCGRWQAPIYVLLAAILTIPCVPLVLASLDLMQMLHSTTQSVYKRFDGDIVLALQATLNEPFKDEAWYWAALLAGQRVLMVCVKTMMKDLITSSVVLCMISGAAFQVQLMNRPFRNQDVNALQTLLCFLLFVEALASVPIHTLEQASVDVSKTRTLGSSTHLLELAIAASSLLPLVALLLVLASTIQQSIKQSIKRCTNTNRDAVSTSQPSCGEPIDGPGGRGRKPPPNVPIRRNVFASAPARIDADPSGMQY
jgi:hypothetical protein